MPRTGPVKKRPLSPDPIYQNRLVARLINRVMRDGKKTVAQNLIYSALKIIKKKTKKDPLEILQKAVLNVKPNMEVRPRRVGGASYQVPIPVKGDRKESLAIRWLIQAAKSRSSKQYRTYDQKLAAELIDAASSKGGAFEKKEQVHKLAEANKAFSHFRW